MTINWQSHDETFFQRFCNALLSLEVSKSFVPFSAPGRDGGIDGLFTGTYDGKTGRWRFQDKFHKTARKTAYNALKKDVVTEIKKLADEDNYLLLTNVELLPGELKELLAIGEKELARYGKEKVSFSIWEGAKIDTIYLRHPILRLWVEDGFNNGQLLSYQDYFGRRLEVGIEDPATLANEFIARQSDLELLSDFVASSTQTVAVVAGEAGIGKTRLVIEFFQKHLDTNDEWQTFVLNPRGIIDKVPFGISGSSNIIILIDDAHGYAPSVIADLRNLLRVPSQRKLKFILTGRRIVIDRALELIPAIDHNTIKQIPLSKLSKIETTELFKRQQNIEHYKPYIPQLVTTSNGRPILIVALLRAIHDNIPIPQIKNTDVLKKYVGEYFNTVIKVVSDHTSVSKLKLERLLRVICLLEPLRLNDDSFYKTLAEFTEISETELRYFLDTLVKEGSVNARHEFVLSPDYYSDILLASADEQLVIGGIAKFPSYISNIIVNLSDVDEANENEENGRLGLDPILHFYINQIPDVHPNTVQDIMETVSTIAYQKPTFAKIAIALLVERITKPQGQSLRDLMAFDTDVRSSSRRSVYGAVSWTLHDLLYRPGNENFVFEAIVGIYSIIPHMGLFENTFALRKSYFINGYQLHPAISFITQALEHLKTNPDTAPFFIEAYKNFLRLDFTVNASDPLNPDQIIIQTIFIPSDPAVVSFRRQVIDALMAVYSTSTKDEIKTKAIHELMDIPRGIAASKQRSKSPYTNTEEILHLLDFIKSIAHTIPLSAKREVTESLFWTKRWGDGDEVIAKVAAIEEALKPTTLPAKILSLITRANTRIEGGYEQLIRKIREQARSLFMEHDASAIAESLSQVYLIQKNSTEYFWPINQGLFENYKDKTNSVYDWLWVNDRKYLHQFGGGYLWAIRFKHDDKESFWTKIYELEKEGSYESLKVILHVYFRLEKPLEDSDNNLIDRLYTNHKDKTQISLHLMMGLAALTKSGYEKSQQLVHLFDICPQIAADDYLQYNLEENPLLLKELLLHHTVRFYFSFAIQHGFSVLSERKVISEDELFAYLIRRFDLHNELLTQRNRYGYQFVPPHEYHNPFGITNDVDRIRLYIRALSWYVKNEWPPMVDYQATDLLEFLQPSKQLSGEMVEAYRKEINTIANSKQLQRMITSLSVFESKTKLYVELVIEILSKRRQIPGSNSEELRMAAREALTAVGIKHGLAGAPFEVDVKLRQLLTDWIADHPEDQFVNSLFQDLIRSLDQDITQSKKRREPLW